MVLTLMLLTIIVSLPVLSSVLIPRYFYNVFFLVLIAVLLRFFICVINISFNIFEPKLAGETSVILYENFINNGILPFASTFLVQMLLSVPFLAIETSLTGLIIANNFWSVLFVVYGFSLLADILEKKAFLVAFILALFFPNFLNFSMFGLRDPLVYALVIVFIASSLALNNKFKIHFLIATVLSVLLIASLRPEMLAPLMLLPSLLVLNSVKSSNIFRSFSKSELLAILSIAYVLIFIFVISLAYYVYILGISAIGYSSVVIPTQVIDEFVTARYDRQFAGTGGDSAIEFFGIQIVSMPIYLRPVFSFFSMLLIPFPWLIQSVSEIFAFVDSLLVIALTYGVFKLRNNAGLTLVQDRSKILLLVFFAGMIIIGLFMVNFGNAFRMRLALMPIIILSFAFIQSDYKKFQKLAYK